LPDLSCAQFLCGAVLLNGEKPADDNVYDLSFLLIGRGLDIPAALIFSGLESSEILQFSGQMPDSVGTSTPAARSTRPINHDVKIKKWHVANVYCCSMPVGNG
jgi:hypothetical protein